MREPDWICHWGHIVEQQRPRANAVVLPEVWGGDVPEVPPKIERAIAVHILR